MIRGVPYDHKLEYIEATGSQYIDTGYVFKVKPRVVTNCMITNGADRDIFGIPQANNYCFIFNPSLNTAVWLYYRYASSISVQVRTDNPGLNSKILVDASDVVSIDGNVVLTLSGARDFSQNSQTFRIFAARNRGYARFYDFKMWDGDTLIGDYIPVSVNGVAMMYDRVTRTFPKHYGTFVGGPVASTPLMGVHMYPTANLWKWPTRATTGNAGPTTVWTPVLDVVYPRVASNGYVNSGYYDPFIAGPNTIYSLYTSGYCAAVFRKLPPGNYKISANISKYSSTYTTAAITVMDYAPSAGQWVLSGNKSSGFKPFGTISMTFTVEPGHLVAIRFSSGQTNASILVKDVSITEVLS